VTDVREKGRLICANMACGRPSNSGRHSPSPIWSLTVTHPHCERENFVTYRATYTLAGPPELRWGNLQRWTAIVSTGPFILQNVAKRSVERKKKFFFLPASLFHVAFTSSFTDTGLSLGKS